MANCGDSICKFRLHPGKFRIECQNETRREGRVGETI